MLFRAYLISLAEDIFAMHERAILLSEEFRKSLYKKNDKGHLEHKTTKRVHNGTEMEIPEKTQHHLHDLLVRKTKIKTGANLTLKDDEIHTHLTDGLFKNSTHAEIEIEFGLEEPPEGIHAQLDQLNSQLKNNLQGGHDENGE